MHAGVSPEPPPPPPPPPQPPSPAMTAPPPQPTAELHAAPVAEPCPVVKEDVKSGQRDVPRVRQTEAVSQDDAGPNVNEDVKSGQRDVPAASEAEAKPQDGAAGVATSKFWPSALKLGRQASKLGGKAKKAIERETQQCANDARGMVDDTKLLGKKIAAAVSAGTQMPAENNSSVSEHVSGAESPPLADGALAQGSATTAETSINTQRDVNAGSSVIGFFQEIRSGWTESAPRDGSTCATSKASKMAASGKGDGEDMDVFSIGSDEEDAEFNEAPAPKPNLEEATEDPNKQLETVPTEQGAVF